MNDKVMNAESLELRRVVRIEVAPEVMLAMMRGDVHFHVAKGLPATAKFRGAGHNMANNSIVLFASDNSFDEVEEGEYPPEFEVEWTRIEPESDEDSSPIEIVDLKLPPR